MPKFHPSPQKLLPLVDLTLFSKEKKIKKKQFWGHVSVFWVMQFYPSLEYVSLFHVPQKLFILNLDSKNHNRMGVQHTAGASDD